MLNTVIHKNESHRLKMQQDLVGVFAEVSVDIDCSWLRHHLMANHHRCCSFQIPTAVTMVTTSASSRQSSIWPRALPSLLTRRAVRRVLRSTASSSNTYRCAPRSVECATPTPLTMTKGTPSRTLLMAPPAGGRAPVFKTGRNMSGSQ